MMRRRSTGILFFIFLVLAVGGFLIFSRFNAPVDSPLGTNKNETPAPSNVNEVPIDFDLEVDNTPAFRHDAIPFEFRAESDFAEEISANQATTLVFEDGTRLTIFVNADAITEPDEPLSSEQVSFQSGDEAKGITAEKKRVRRAVDGLEQFTLNFVVRDRRVFLIGSEAFVNAFILSFTPLSVVRIGV